MAENGAASVYINENTTRGNTVLGRNFRLIYGKERITDTLCDVKYEISPRAFYQINREQTEKLYSYALDLAQITPEDTVLDLFCGIGTITLLAAKRGAKRVVGIEIVEGRNYRIRSGTGAPEGIEKLVRNFKPSASFCLIFL